MKRRCGALTGAFALVTILAALIAAGPAAAQSLTLTLPEGTGLTERALQLVALITVLSIAPSILVMVTSFTRIAVVLSLLRTAIGTNTAPSNTVMVSLALFLTAFIMAPTFQTAYDQGIQPLVAGTIDQAQAFERTTQPFHDFMMKNVREKDLALFLDMARQPRPESRETSACASSFPPS